MCDVRCTLIHEVYAHMRCTSIYEINACKIYTHDAYAVYEVHAVYEI
jgi:hypothetical protein